jgi:hypothetical protein
MNVSCQCDRMNMTVGWENKTRSSASLYTCYHGQCYPSSHGTENKTTCEDTCKPDPTPPPTPPVSGAKYYCHQGKCQESFFGTETYQDCESRCTVIEVIQSLNKIY